MLELTFGVDGRQNQIAFIMEALQEGYLLTAKEISLFIEQDLGYTQELLDKLEADASLYKYSYQDHFLYGPLKADTRIQVIDQAEFDESMGESRALEATLETVKAQISELKATLKRMETELEILDALTQKWSSAAVELHQEIQRSWGRPVRLRDLATQAGFDFDTFDLDYEESDGEAQHESENDYL